MVSFPNFIFLFLFFSPEFSLLLSKSNLNFNEYHYLSRNIYKKIQMLVYSFQALHNTFLNILAELLNCDMKQQGCLFYLLNLF
jgi:hypothetical protein